MTLTILGGLAGVFVTVGMIKHFGIEFPIDMLLIFSMSFLGTCIGKGAEVDK